MDDFCVGDVHPTVVDLDLLADLHVIVEDHFLAAADDDGADFDRGQPVVVEMGNEAAVEIHGQIGDVLDPIADVAGAIGTDAHRRFLDEMVEDGDVMGCQIPKDVDVALNQAEVDADGIEIVQFPQVATRTISSSCALHRYR